MISVILTPTTGQRIPVNPHWSQVQLSAASTLDSLALALPSLFESSFFILSTDTAITNFSVVPTGADVRIVGAPIQLAAGEVLAFTYTPFVKTWSVVLSGNLPVQAGAGTYYILGTDPLLVQITDGAIQAADVGLILRRGILMGLPLLDLVPPAATLLGGANGGFSTISLDPSLTMGAGRHLAVTFGSSAGTSASGDALAAVKATSDGAMPKSGGGFLGPVTLASDPTQALQPVTKRYADAISTALAALGANLTTAISTAQGKVDAAMPKSGGVFSGPITLFGPPAQASDPVTKLYADTADAANAAASVAAQALAQSGVDLARAAADGALAKSANLSDITSAAQARFNLALGPAALLTVGVGHNQLAAADDPRIVNAVQNTDLGSANGVATLDAGGHLKLSQLPPSVVGALQYAGTWDASNNVPILTSGQGVTGHIFVVSQAGATLLDGTSTWLVGDWAVFDGAKWDHLSGLSTEVQSVIGLTGAVTLAALVANGLAPLDGALLTGLVRAPTAARGTNSTQLATCAFVQGQGFAPQVGANLSAAAITGSTVNGTAIGGTTPAPGGFTTLAAQSITLSGTIVQNSFLASPAGAAGSPGFRTIAPSDLPAATTTVNGAVQAGTGLAISVAGALSVAYGATANTAVVGNDPRVVGALQTSNSLSELSGTAALARSNLGLGSLATQGAGGVAITGGSINGTVIGAGTPAAASVTSLTVSTSITLPSQTAKSVLAAPNAAAGAPVWRQLANTDISGFGSISVQASSNVSLTGGTIDGTVIGGTTAAAGSFAALSASGPVVLGTASSLVVGPATGGAKGAGSINAASLYINGVAVSANSALATATTAGSVIVPTAGGLSVDGAGNLSVNYAAAAFTGGTINGTTVGATTPATGTFSVLAATTTFKMPTWTTTARPASPTAGMVGFASDTARFEFYNGSAWNQHVRLSGDTLTGLLTANIFASSGATLTGGAIDGTPIGAATPSTAKVTTLSVSGTAIFSGGAALALTATTGFVYLPTTAGVPTGTPAAVAGGAPVLIDTTDSRLYFYSGGAWQTPSGSGSAPAIPTANLLGGASGAYTSVTVGTGLSLAAGTLAVSPATASALGGVIVGSGLSVSAGTVSVTAPYTAANVLQVANNLSDVANAGLARMNIDAGIVALTSGATVATNAALGNVFSLTLAVNATLSNPSALKAGAHYMWIVKQDTTGGRTLAYGTAFKWANASPPTLSTGAGQVDIISGVSDGTNIYCILSTNFA